MLYLGSQEKGFYINDVALKHDLTPEYSGEATHIAQQIEKALKTTHKYIVIYLDQYIDPADVIVDYIIKIKEASNAKIIIDSCGYAENSELVTALKSAGFNLFVSAVSLGRKASELETAIDPKRAQKSPSIAEFEETEETPQKNIFYDFSENRGTQNLKNIPTNKSIAVAGACSRIGTTTQAIQIAKYLQFKGYRAAYIEANANGYVKLLPDIYEKTIEDPTAGKVSCKSLDMIYDVKTVNQLKDYDYCVFDFGVYGNQHFQNLSYIDKEIKIVVGGTSPTELIQMNAVLASVLDEDITYIFSFTDRSEQNDIRKLMSHKSNETFFANYTPQPFNLSSESIKLYDSIFELGDLPMKKNKLMNILPWRNS